MDDLSKDIALIKKDLAYIRKELDENLVSFKDHVKTSHEYRNKVLVLEGMDKTLNQHVVQDMWVQGMIFTSMIAILTKLTGVW